MTDNKDLIGQYCRQFNMSGIPASLDQYNTPLKSDHRAS